MARVLTDELPDELWKPMPCCSEHFVSSLGRIARRSADVRRPSGLIVFQPWLASPARIVVSLHHCGSRSEFVVKDVVARAFIGVIPVGYEAINRNGDALDNRALNIGIVPRGDFVVGEEWRPVVGWPSYEVSDLGRVRRVGGGPAARRGRVLAQHVDGRGYTSAALCFRGISRLRLIHRLVAEAFIGPIADGMQVDHIDSDKTNNRVGNLQIVTAKENTSLYHERSEVLGLHHGHLPVLSLRQVLLVDRLRTAGETIASVAAMLGVGRNTVKRATHRAGGYKSFPLPR